jgi:hypothetical protein
LVHHIKWTLLVANKKKGRSELLWRLSGCLQQNEGRIHEQENDTLILDSVTEEESTTDDNHATDWRTPYFEYLKNRQVRGENITNEKQLQWTNKCKRFILDGGTLIRLLPNGDTRICVTRSRGGKLIAATYNAKGKHLTLPMTKQLIFFSPYWWPTIDEDIKYHAEYECEECMLQYINIKGIKTTTLKGISPLDWRKPYVEYLSYGKVTSNDLTGEEKERIANRSQFFAITNDKLMRQFVANEIPKECISENRIQ